MKIKISEILGEPLELLRRSAAGIEAVATQLGHRNDGQQQIIEALGRLEGKVDQMQEQIALLEQQAADQQQIIVHLGEQLGQINANIGNEIRALREAIAANNTPALNDVVGKLTANNQNLRGVVENLRARNAELVADDEPTPIPPGGDNGGGEATEASAAAAPVPEE